MSSDTIYRGYKNMDWACRACGDEEHTIHYPVLKRLPDGDLEEFYVCENCVPHFEKVEYLIQRFDGQLFPIAERPKQWRNDKPLRYDHGHIIYYMLEQQLSHLDEKQRLEYIQEHAFDPTRLPLNDFPLVEDFEVSLEGAIARHNISRKPIPYFMVSLYSPSFGYLGHFSGHDDSRYLCRSNFVIPHGDFTLPYYDLEQGVDLLITEDDRFVYVLFGDWERHNAGHESGVWYEIENYYDTWVKVRRERYYEQWKIAIEKSCAYHSSNASF